MESKANDLKTIQILYKALLAGQLIFAAIITFLVTTGRAPSQSTSASNVFLIVAVVVALACIPAGYILFRQRIEVVKQQNDFSAKLEGYRASLILQLGLSEMPALLAIIMYFMTSNQSFLILLVLLFVNFLNLYPSRNKIVKQLELNSEEEAMLE
ncbi:MAG: hypothetical protein JST75_08565 [Bacteroidetes bacterium]|nr:hypothetical protein [Bacteroidota bacterium]